MRRIQVLPAPVDAHINHRKSLSFLCISTAAHRQLVETILLPLLLVTDTAACSSSSNDKNTASTGAAALVQLCESRRQLPLAPPVSSKLLAHHLPLAISYVDFDDEKSSLDSAYHVSPAQDSPRIGKIRSPRDRDTGRYESQFERFKRPGQRKPNAKKTSMELRSIGA